jgi:hypothetical protein
MNKADPRGIRRMITVADWQYDGTHIVFNCGHETLYPPHFAPPRINSEAFCFKCGQEDETAAKRRARDMNRDRAIGQLFMASQSKRPRT